jgi:hypothetical protein
VPLLRNADRAIIRAEKVRDYLLNPANAKNNGKWRLFVALGYSRSNWERMADDLREQHLGHEAVFSRRTPFGDMYEIVARLQGPAGRATIKSIWQYDIGSDRPRFISAYGG